ncbi:MAG: carbohydrate binding domain-containing protein [Gemmatimonadaceae bacterium]|nr:carbohydrate binding domain-containing protein [Gemmatimonadaceae bacterium]
MCLLGITLAEWWQPWLFGSKRKAAIWILATLCISNYVAFAAGGGLPIEHRMAQATVIFGYTGACSAGLASVLRILPERRAFALALACVLGLLVIELALSPRQGKFLWAGGVALVAASSPPAEDGSTPASGTIVSDYPEDPRGYFEDPETWRASWRVDVNEIAAGSTLEFPATRAEALRAIVRRGGLREPWFVQVAQTGVSLRQGERYSLSFRARAAVPGTLYVAAGMGHPPWTAIGLYEQVTVDSLWRHVQLEFTPTASDPSAKLYFDIGLMQDTVELSRITLRRSATGERVVPVARHRHAVRYRYNQMGCRGASVHRTPRPGVYRILVVGGASSRGVGVHEEDTFASQLQDR